jgi:hypothetical protein
LARLEEALAAVRPTPSCTAHALTVEAEALVATLIGASLNRCRASRACPARLTITLIRVRVAHAVRATLWVTVAGQRIASDTSEAWAAHALAVIARAMSRAIGVWTEEPDSAVFATPAFFAYTQGRVVARTVTTTTATEGAIDAEEARIAKARALHAIALMGTLVGAIGLASVATITRVAMAVPRPRATAMVVAILRAGRCCQEPEACSLAEAVHRRWGGHRLSASQPHCEDLIHGVDLAAVRAFEPCSAPATPSKAIASAGAIVRASRMGATVPEETIRAHALALDADTLAMAISGAPRHVA